MREEREGLERGDSTLLRPTCTKGTILSNKNITFKYKILYN